MEVKYIVPNFLQICGRFKLQIPLRQFYTLFLFTFRTKTIITTFSFIKFLYFNKFNLFGFLKKHLSYSVSSFNVNLFLERFVNMTKIFPRKLESITPPPKITDLHDKPERG